MRHLTLDQRQIFDAALARFRAEYPDIGAQTAVWSDLAAARFADDVATIRADATDAERAEGLPLLADLAVLDAALGWQRAIQGAA